ncbi:MAG: radical SAM protein [Myxococcales bacterium]|nr:radical SAM protein [Myxococcales bacterium]
MSAPTTPATSPNHARAVTTKDRQAPHPLYCVWEITLACDLGCKHCGSRAGPSRPDELTTQQCLDVVHELADLGLREVTLIGGEAYLRDDWHLIAAEITRLGMMCGITTGALALTPERVAMAEDAGVRTISISIDGLAQIHDAQRGVPGSWRSAVDAAQRVSQSSMRLATNSQINRLSMPELPAMASLLADIGSRAWQIQLTVPMGHAADRPDLLLQPWELLELYPLLVWIKEQRLDPNGITLYPGNNIGYFGPYEQALRYGGDKGAHWQGCSAGEWTLGLEADGKIKGCPSLPSNAWTGGYLGRDNLRQVVKDTPELSYLRNRTVDDLWGFCRGCYYADVCKAGCTWTSFVFFARDGNNPYCIHRAMHHADKGQRERLRLAEAAPGTPFDNGRFDLVVEPSPSSPSADAAQPTVLGFDLADVLALQPNDRSIWSEDKMWQVLGGRSRKGGQKLTLDALQMGAARSSSTDDVQGGQ